MGSQASGKRIVLAEDDDSLRSLLASALEFEGYDVLQAGTGRDLLEVVSSAIEAGKTVDLIISDVRMPKLGGLEALKMLRERGLVIPVLLMTAFGDLWTEREACAHGATLLNKPVHLRTLREHVEKVLRAGDPSKT